MPPQIDLFCIGFAAVVDSVLLLVVLERINRPLTAVWLKWALAGVTVWHISSFLHETLRNTVGATATQLDGMCMIAMTFGLVLLTSGILHAGLRINHSGTTPNPSRDWRYVAVYLPLLFVVAVGHHIIRSGSRDFILVTRPFHTTYLIWLVFSNVTAVSMFLKNSRRTDRERMLSARFLFRFCVGLIVVTVLTLTYVVWGYGSSLERPLRLLTTLSPLIPTLIFAYYIFRRRLLPLVFERTLAYGASLLAVVYLHWLTLSPLVEQYSDALQFDFFLIEALVLVALVLTYQPLRRRIQEGLRYLLGSDVSRVRGATRQLSVELIRRSHDAPDALSQWFVETLRDTLQLSHIALSHNLVDQPYCAQAECGETAFHLSDSSIRAAAETFPQSDVMWIDRFHCDSQEQLAVMQKLDLIAVFHFEYNDIRGIVLLGVPLSGDRLSDERLNTVTLLLDQYAATVHNRRLEHAKQTAERRAVQQEKLSTLGLLSGSLAHELRNPLSSMRTIASLLKENLDNDSDSVRDVNIIISEIDRLTLTTQRLLDFSRPPDASIVGVCPDRVIERLLHILTHLARQHGVAIDTDLRLNDIKVNATDASLSEILFNLIRNAIEAVRQTRQPHVTIATSVGTPTTDDSQAVLVSVADNGPGIAPELQDRIFQPFVTGKDDGTGLGLYLVSERVRELGGTVNCISSTSGTVFEIMLPGVSNSEQKLISEKRV